MRTLTLYLAMVALLFVGCKMRPKELSETEINRGKTEKLYNDLINKGRLELTDSLIAIDMKADLGPDNTQGQEAFRQYIAGLREAFPDLHIITGAMIAEDDIVAVNATFSGTHKGKFMGIPPTGRYISTNMTDVLRFRNGRLAEYSGAINLLPVLDDLGIKIPRKSPWAKSIIRGKSAVKSGKKTRVKTEARVKSKSDVKTPRKARQHHRPKRLKKQEEVKFIEEEELTAPELSPPSENLIPIEN